MFHSLKETWNSLPEFPPTKRRNNLPLPESIILSPMSVPAGVSGDGGGVGVSGEDWARRNSPNVTLSSDSPWGSFTAGFHDIRYSTFIGTQGFLLIYFMAIALVFFLAFKLNVELKFRYIPESVLAILAGMIVSVAANTYATGFSETGTEVDPRIFFYFLLPPLIFQAGYEQDRRPLISNWLIVLLYANVGTVISAVTFAYGIYYLGYSGMIQSLTIMESLCFGALISATDPVASLATFAQMKVDSNLNAIVYGTSVVDDAIAIIMFFIFRDEISKEAKSPHSSDHQLGTVFAMTVILYMAVCIIASIGLGCLLGGLGAIVVKHSQMFSYPNKRAMLCATFCFPFVCHFVGVCLQISGILTCLVGALSFRYFIDLGKLLSENDKEIIQYGVTLSGSFCEVLAFFAMGLAFVTMLMKNVEWFQISFIAWAFFLTILSRAVFVYPLAFVANVYYYGFDWRGIFMNVRGQEAVPHGSVNEEENEEGIRRNGMQEPLGGAVSRSDDEERGEYTPNLAASSTLHGRDAVETKAETKNPIASYISMNMQHMILLSGIRGPISFNGSERFATTTNTHMISATILVIALTNIFVNGALTEFALKLLGVSYGLKDTMGQEQKNDEGSVAAHAGVAHAGVAMVGGGAGPSASAGGSTPEGIDHDEIGGQERETRAPALISDRFHRFEISYLVPIFTRKTQTTTIRLAERANQEEIRPVRRRSALGSLPTSLRARLPLAALSPSRIVPFAPHEGESHLP